MLKMFSSSPEVDAILNVGCCYNLMTVDGDEPTQAEKAPPPEQPGYPLSSLCERLLPKMIRDVRRLACHSIERRNDNSDEMERVHKSHSYRAVFQHILESHFSIVSRQYSGPINKVRVCWC